MDIVDIAKQIAGIALPAAANIFVPGSGELAKKVIDSALGITGAPTPEQAVDVLQTHPELQVQMRQAMLTHEEVMAEIGRKAAEAERADALKAEQQLIDDRASARQREVSIKDTINRNLAYAVVGGFLALVGTVLLGYTNADSALAGTLVGYVSAKCEQVLSYYFGSSRGQDVAHAQAIELAKQLPPGTQPPAPIEDHSSRAP